MTAALLLFLTPADWRKGEFLLRWEDVRSIRWNVLILFGGGLALAEAISSSGLAAWIGAAMAGLTGLPLVLLVLIVMFATVMVGELATSTAMAATFLPVAGAAAVGMGETPLALALPVAMAASLGFVPPVATPPNAIVYGSSARDDGADAPRRCDPGCGEHASVPVPTFACPWSAIGSKCRSQQEHEQLYDPSVAVASDVW